jgi:hypothetical protein
MSGHCRSLELTVRPSELLLQTRKARGCPYQKIRADASHGSWNPGLARVLVRAGMTGDACANGAEAVEEVPVETFAARAGAKRRNRIAKQEGGSDRPAETCLGRDPAGDHGGHGWQKHTVRGFVGILGSKGGEKVESAKNAGGERTYRIAK